MTTESMESWIGVCRELKKKVEQLEAQLRTTQKDLHETTETADAARRYTGAFVTFAWLADPTRAEWAIRNNNSWENATTSNGINLASKYPNAGQ